jgi:hypothetical protein
VFASRFHEDRGLGTQLEVSVLFRKQSKREGNVFQVNLIEDQFPFSFLKIRTQEAVGLRSKGFVEPFPEKTLA